MTLPSNWRKVLQSFDLIEVREDLSKMFELAKFEAAKEGAYPVQYPVEMVAAWQRFAANPSLPTATALLEVAPQLWTAFETSGPGWIFRLHGLGQSTDQP